VELGLDGQPVRDEKRALYLERFIHAPSTRRGRTFIPSSTRMRRHPAVRIAQATPLRPVIHSGSSSAPMSRSGHRRQVRRHQSPGHQHGPGARPREVPGRQQRRADAGHGFASAGRSLIEWCACRSTCRAMRERSCMPSNWAARSSICAGEIDAATGATVLIRSRLGGRGNFGDKAGCAHMLTGRPRPRAQEVMSAVVRAVHGCHLRA